jgi:phosphosulfolactate phosphohydrolase-like enzyme
MGPHQKSVPRTASAATGVATVIDLLRMALILPVAMRKAATLVLTASSLSASVRIEDIAIDHHLCVLAERQLGLVAEGDLQNVP